MEKFTITPLLEEVITVNNLERLPYIQADLEKKYGGKVSLRTTQYYVVVPILEKEPSTN